MRIQIRSQLATWGKALLLNIKDREIRPQGREVLND